mmetsp:Transcript_8452/g.12490  ORF Transcript_8452/g.12490 Transcript_8452/m.12490 type:complete len:289 (+) Transcript_8452:118-984(+)
MIIPKNINMPQEQKRKGYDWRRIGRVIRKRLGQAAIGMVRETVKQLILYPIEVVRDEAMYSYVDERNSIILEKEEDNTSLDYIYRGFKIKLLTTAITQLTKETINVILILSKKQVKSEIHTDDSIEAIIASQDALKNQFTKASSLEILKEQMTIQKTLVENEKKVLDKKKVSLTKIEEKLEHQFKLLLNESICYKYLNDVIDTALTYKLESNRLQHVLHLKESPAYRAHGASQFIVLLNAVLDYGLSTFLWKILKMDIFGHNLPYVYGPLTKLTLLPLSFLQFKLRTK